MDFFGIKKFTFFWIAGTVMPACSCSDQCSGYSCQRFGHVCSHEICVGLALVQELGLALVQNMPIPIPRSRVSCRAAGLADAEREEPNFSPNGLFLPRDPHRDILIYIVCCKYVWRNMHEPDFGRNGRVAHFGRKDLDYEVSCSGLRANIRPCTFFPVHTPKLLPS